MSAATHHLSRSEFAMFHTGGKIVVELFISVVILAKNVFFPHFFFLWFNGIRSHRIPYFLLHFDFLCFLRHPNDYMKMWREKKLRKTDNCQWIFKVLWLKIETDTVICGLFVGVYVCAAGIYVHTPTHKHTWGALWKYAYFICWWMFFDYVFAYACTHMKILFSLSLRLTSPPFISTYVKSSCYARSLSYFAFVFKIA